MTKTFPLFEIDSFGTPPAARSSMMCVAGEEENDEEQLLTDEGDDTTMKGPIYQREGRLGITVGMLRRIVRDALRYR